MRPTALGAIGVTVWTALGLAQQPPSRPPSQTQPPSQALPPAPTFRATTRLIVQTVNVKDKDGRPLEGLTAKDFLVTEDGEPQTVSFVEFQRLAATPDANASVTVGGAFPDATLTSPPRVAASSVVSVTDTKISAGKPGDIKYRDRRLLVLYFDLTALPPLDLLRAYNAARKFINTQMTTADLVAVMGFQGAACASNRTSRMTKHNSSM